jgi:site-specific DNA recombinase
VVSNELQKAVIYTRVSSAKQAEEGSGLDSQEHLCRSYAASRGLHVVAVFPDDFTGAGNFMARPGMRDLLRYLSQHRKTRHVVIFDDLKRLARDTKFHIQLRETFRELNATVASPNYRFDDETPEAEFAETVFAAQGQLERKQNRRQVIQKMKARIERGYWTFFPSPGYTYVADIENNKHGKVLVRKEPDASIVQEALAGFASGRFQTQTEVQRFFQSRPESHLKNVTKSRVREILETPLYAGMVGAPQWNVPFRRGRHPALISYEDHLKILERLKTRSHAAIRKDLNRDFPLRGFVVCGDCCTPLTACWSKGRTGYYAYYLCPKKGCASYGKSVARDKLEGEFRAFISTLAPNPALFQLVSAMFKDAWGQRSQQTQLRRKSLEVERNRLSRSIDQLIDKIGDLSTPSVIGALEKRIGILESEKLVIEEKMAARDEPSRSFDATLRTALQVVENPAKLWDSDHFEHKRLLLRMIFMRPMKWARNSGFRTADLALPFKVLGDFSGAKKWLVEGTGFEPVYAVKRADLQSAGFNHSPTPPGRPCGS